MRKRRIKLPVKLIIIVITIFIGIFSILNYTLRFLKTSDYFKVQDIIFSQDNIIDLAYLEGENIFSVNLPKESARMLQEYPAYRKINLVRVLPNRIFVDSIKRTPVALLRLYRLFAVDAEGVLFDPAAGAESADLPLILGLEKQIFRPQSGKKYNIKELIFALNIINELKTNPFLKDYQVKKIDVSTLDNAALDLKGLEIKLGIDNINDKINILAGLLAQVKNDLPNIKYIDLRFREPVIKFKNAE